MINKIRMNNPFKFIGNAFDNFLVKSIQGLIPTKVMAHRKDGTAYLTTVYKKPLEDCNNVEDLRQLVEPYGIDISKDVENDIEFRHIKEVCEGIMEVKDRFPKLKSLITKLKVFDSDILNPFKTDIDGNISFHYRYMRKGHSVLDERMATDGNRQWFNGLVTAKELAYHEMGHVILGQLCKHNPELWNNNTLASDIVDIVYETLVKKNIKFDEDNICKEISLYANENDSEGIAEAVRDIFQHKEKAKEISKIIIKILEEKLR